MSLQTQIELRDNFSAILNGIVSSISLSVDSMYDMQAAMNADVNRLIRQRQQYRE